MSLPRNVVRALRPVSHAHRSLWRPYSTGSSSSSSSSSSRPRVVATSASLGLAVAAYATWHITAERNRIALDARVSPSSAQTTHFTHTPPTGAGLPPPPDELPPPPTRVGTPPPPPLHEDSPPTLTPPRPEFNTPKPGVQDQVEPDSETGGSSESAFDPKTGEINWDCPCLGGMAHGPCGMEFREAFSCFVFSEAEPKGMDCIEKFRAMQDCFRDHPDVYAEELMDDDEGEPSVDRDGATESVTADPSSALEVASPGSPEPALTSSPTKAETKFDASKPPEPGKRV